MSNNSLSKFRNCHGGDSIIVSGLGVSATKLKFPERMVTIGVNDIGRLYTPTYLVVLNKLENFEESRRHWITDSRARVVFSHLDIALQFSELIKFRLGEQVNLDTDSLPYSNNSPFVAIQLARLMGASRIGVLGLDFLDDHFFEKSGPHKLVGQLDTIERDYDKLVSGLKSEGIELFNLSHKSRLESIPKIEFEERDWLPKICARNG